MVSGRRIEDHSMLSTEPSPEAQAPASTALAGADIDALKSNAGRAAAFLKALAHEHRLLLLCLLCEGERSVTELETLLGVRQPAVSQQLARLRLDGLVTTRREGKAIYYRLANADVQRVLEVVHDIYCGNGGAR